MNENAALFRYSLAASLALHGGFFLLVRFRAPRVPAVEIDLTQSLTLGTGPAKLGAPKRLVPTAPKGPALPAETPTPAPPQPAPPPPKDWVLPGPQTQVIEKPAPPPPTPGGSPNGSGTSPLTGGVGAGADYGTPGGLGTGGAPLLSLPRLLNKDDVLANLRRFYPEAERRAGREGRVVVTLHIGADGKVGAVEIASSAGDAFDAAAVKVGHLMLFSPALGREGPVAVKISQTMIFQLTGE